MPRRSFRNTYGAARKWLSWSTGPYIGVRDYYDPSASNPRLARMLKNCWPIDPHIGSRAIGRPGVSQLGAQLGAGGDVQFIGQLTKLNGTEYTVAIVGGKFYTLDWGTSTWTEVVSAANFATATITVSSTARFYAVTFADTLLFSDGVNLPWTWDGQSGAGGLTSLTNAPVFFGKPTVHYGKVFGIKNADRSTLVWSEEGTPNTGYEAGGYNNAWTLRQTDQNQLTHLEGANESLYVFRAYSITEIYGEVNDNFRSTGTRESVSETIGTTAPGSVFFESRNLYFTDAQGRPHVIRPGLGPVEIWSDFTETLELVDPTKVAQIEGYWDPQLELAIEAFEDTSSDDRSTQLCYHSNAGGLPQAAAVFDGYTFTRVGEVKNGDGQPVIVHGDTSGYIYLHGAWDGDVLDDELATGTVPIYHEVTSPYVGASDDLEKHFDRIDMSLYRGYDMTAVQITTLTARGTGTPVDVTVAQPNVALWDIAQWDEDEWSESLGTSTHLAVGINDFGPHCGVRISHEEDGERFTFGTLTIKGRALTLAPQMQ